MSAEKENAPETGSSNKFYKRTVRFLWLASIAGLLFAVAYFVYLTNQDLPTFEDLENPKYNLASEVYSGNEKSLGRFYIENRVPAQYNELNPYLIDALIATEDERYLDHAGIDFQALGRVAVGVLTLNSSKGGGSTITQQLAKLLYDRPNLKGNALKRMIVLIDTKLKEWITAVKLEKSYTKEEIIAMYLNKFEFIFGAHGIKAAAEIYFGKKQEDLDKNEAAMLVGMLKNPSEYNPIKFPSNAKKRMTVVLNQMRKNGKISDDEYESLKEIDLDMSNFKRTDHSDGLAPYFRMELGKYLKRMFEREEFRKPDGTKYDIYRDGLKIYTTIDEKMQALAEETMKEHMTVVQKTYDNRWKKRDPWTYEMERWSTDIRKRSLESLIRNSDRYKAVQKKYLNPALDEFRSIDR
ncbi:MAG: transglycosylase domain-containing protein, partial [Bacteroidota bacterium]